MAALKTSSVASSCPHSSCRHSLRRTDGGIKTSGVASPCPHSSRASSHSLRRRDGGIEDIRCCIVQSEIESVVASGEEMAALRHLVLHPVHPPVVVSVSGEETASLRECMLWADCVLSVLSPKASRFLSTRFPFFFLYYLKSFHTSDVRLILQLSC